MASSTSTFVTTESKGNYVLVCICREPVNSMNLQLWQQLLDALDKAEANKSIKGMIIYSGVQRDVFTAGNDINELFAPKTSEQRYLQFWKTQTTFLARLYRSRLTTIAAIRGACPAGGCITALCCDIRIQSENEGSIFGLNEVSIGITVPKRWAQLFIRYAGAAKGELLLASGQFVSSLEAVKLGLITKTVPRDQLLPEAEKEITKQLKIPSSGRETTKNILRAEFSHLWESEAEEEGRQAWKFLSSPPVVKQLEQTLQRLSKSNSSKPVDIKPKL